MRTGHLFAGAGGGLYADIILGHRPQFAVEWDGYAAQCLRERANDGWWPGLHVHEGDVQLFDSSPWRGRVDSLHAGFPCQDISVAGTGAGITGERSGLWAEVVRVADDIRPRELFLENSPAITSRGLEQVLGDLADLGFDAEWIVLSASAVGAPHIRARWWCLARRTDSDCVRQLQPKRELRNERGWACDLGEDVSDTLRQRYSRQATTEEPTHNQEWDGEAHRQNRRNEPGEAVPSCENVANTMRQRQQGIIASITDEEKRGQQRKRQARSQSNGDGWWTTEPGMGRVVDGLANRGNRIKALGNGQVPLQAAAAYVLLDARLGT